jgi:orotate phosphoribosyltransferase
VEAIDGLRELGKEVRDAIVVVDRNEGSREALAAKGVMLHALLTGDDLRSAARPA